MVAVRIRRADTVAEVDDDVGALDRLQHLLGVRVGRVRLGDRRAARLRRVGGGIGQADVDRRQLLTDRPDDDRHLGRGRGVRGRGDTKAGDHRRQRDAEDQDLTHAFPPWAQGLLD